MPIEQGIEETDEQVLVHLRAEQLLEAEVGIGVYVSFLFFVYHSVLFSSIRRVLLRIAVAKLANYPIRTKKNVNYFIFQRKLKTLVTRHQVFYGFDYQRIMRVMSG